MVAGNGNDTIQITATDFVSIDGGAGFDTLVLANGIDLDYNAVGVGTLSNSSASTSARAIRVAC